MLYAGILVALIIIFIFLRPLKQKKSRVGQRLPGFKVDEDMAVQRLSDIIQCKTVSLRGGEDYSGFLRLHELLRQSYPLVHNTLECRVVNDYSLLYHWRVGGDKLPIMLMAHQDVVPAEGEGWQYPPFSGEVAEGCVWGRGAIDMKNMLAAELEALELLISESFEPDRDIYLLFGHDEEIMGLEGAKHAASLLREKEVYFEFILDEGCSFSSMEHYGIADKLAANIGVYEKGYVDLKLIAEGGSGHSSTPDQSTTLSDLSRAVNILESSLQFKPELTAAYKQRLECLLPNTSYTTRFTATYMAAFSDNYIRLLENSPEEYSMLRSTMAATMISGSEAPNILPGRAEAMFNFRLNPGYSVKKLQNAIAGILPDRIKQEYPTAHNASPSSSTDSRAYGLISDAILDTFDDVVVAPCGFPACTDSRYFQGMAKDIYRFIPFMSNYKLKSGMHGTDERIDIEDYLRGIEFFIRLIKNTCGDK